MKLTLLKCKLHRLTITDADLDYEGSLTLDADLMDAACLVPHERVEIYNVTNGSRIATYVIEGERGSRVAQANGAAAHHVRRGDIVIVSAYAEMTPDEARQHQPTIVLVKGQNEPVDAKSARWVAGGPG